MQDQSNWIAGQRFGKSQGKGKRLEVKLKDSIQVTLPPTYLLFDTIKSVGRNQQTPIDCSEYALLASCCLALCYRRFHHVNDRRQINHYD